MIRDNLKRASYKLIILTTKIIGYGIKLVNWKKRKVLVFTDSRGFEITKIYNRKNPFSSYVRKLIKNFNTDFFICNEKHTTFFDFIQTYEKLKQNKNHYDYVILHCGVVDFSPRVAEEINDILKVKKNKIIECFGEVFFEKLKNFKGYSDKYDGKFTTSILPQDFIPLVAKYLNKIENLVWITCNPVDLNWRGNYKRDRPKNINIVNESSKIMIPLLSNASIINLTNLTINEVHEYTCDNIHLSKNGMRLLEKEIFKIINSK